MSEPHTSVIIVNYNTEDLVIDLIDSIETKNVSIIVVDNSNNSIFPERLPTKVQYVKSPNNLGYTGGNNLGIQECIGESDYALIINPDVLIQSEDFIQTLVQKSEQCDDIGVLGPKINDSLSEQESLKEKILRCLGILPKLPDRDDSIYYYSSIPGCAMLVDLDLHEKIGGFDARFFMYQDEVDYCYRAQKEGYLIGTCDSVVLEHSDEYTDFPKDTDYKLYYYLRNGFLITSSVFRNLSSVVVLILHILTIVVNMLRIARNKRFDLLVPLYYSIVDGLIGNYGRYRYL